MSNTTVRVLVAIVGIPCIVALSLLGGFWFWGLVAVVSAGALIELYRLFEAKGARPFIVDGVIAGIVITTLFELKWVYRGGYFDCGFMSSLIRVCSVFILFTGWVLLRGMFRREGSNLVNIASTLAGVAYVPMFLGTLIGIRELFHSEWVSMQIGAIATQNGKTIAQTLDTYGGATIVSIFAIIWICDSAAYFGGRAMGRHKLFERVSPKKTWEGALWGFAGAVGAAVAAKALVLTYLTLGDSIVVGSIVGIFGQLGDLAESALKRDAGVKDSSSIIPGHGGILDRFDSLLFVSPLLYGYLGIIVQFR